MRPDLVTTVATDLAATSTSSLLTVGHGAASQDALTELLRASGVALVVDVRRFPGSRAHPHVARDALAEWLPAAGVGYRWEPRLGGRRARPVDPDEAARDGWWQVAAFRAYAAHTRTPEFVAGLDDLVRDARARTTAVMCSESLWWRCHRRLVADAALLLRGLPVLHLGHDGRRTPHVPSAGAHVGPDGLSYPPSP